jgi:kynurenine formamidase
MTPDVNPARDLVFEPLFEEAGMRVSRSPWGADDEIGRLNWITAGSVSAVLGSLATGPVFDLGVEYFVGMPAWTGSGDPKYEHFLTHTPQGSVVDGMTGASPEVQQRHSLSADAILMNTHCGTHIDTLNHLGYCGRFWNGWNADEHLGGRCWEKGGADRYPPIVARGVLLDVAALHGVERVPTGYEVTPDDLCAAAQAHGVELRRGDVVVVRTGAMTTWPTAEYLGASAGIGLAAARHLCEEAGAMCVATDTIAFEVLPPQDGNSFLPVHSYMFATAGAQIIEAIWTEGLAAAGVHEFCFIGAPLKLHGSTGSPLRPLAIPLAA